MAHSDVPALSGADRQTGRSASRRPGERLPSPELASTAAWATRRKRATPHLDLKPAPGRVDLPQVLLHKGQRRQPALALAHQAHALGVQPEVVVAHLQTRHEREQAAVLDRPGNRPQKQRHAVAWLRLAQLSTGQQAGQRGSWPLGTVRAPTCTQAVPGVLTSLMRCSTASAALALSSDPASCARCFTSASAACRSQPLSPCKQRGAKPMYTQLKLGTVHAAWQAPGRFTGGGTLSKGGRLQLITPRSSC